tara:strand:- start:1268 stop:1441 length:174 start_codon:yes stop_codon:yes gene_type:complete
MRLDVIDLVFVLILLMEQSTAQQAFRLANEAMMVTNSDTKVLFDPLHLESYGPYQLI